MVIEDFTGIRRHGTKIELRVKWRGFPDSESDWNNYGTLVEDVPDMVREYLDELRRSGTKREKALAASI